MPKKIPSDIWAREIDALVGVPFARISPSYFSLGPEAELDPEFVTRLKNRLIEMKIDFWHAPGRVFMDVEELYIGIYPGGTE